MKSIYARSRYKPKWKKEHYAAESEITDFIQNIVDRMSESGEARNINISYSGTKTRFDFERKVKPIKLRLKQPK